MEIIIKGTKIKITPKIKEYIEERIKSTEKYIKTNLPIIVKFEVEKVTEHHNKGNVFRAEANIHLKNKFLRAEATREDIYLAINEVRDRLKEEFRKYKEINIDRKRRNAKL
jgi:ribosomal subunit interface protein